MEKLKNFFSNYKSDILNVLGVVALIAVIVVGAVLFFGKDEAQPNIVEDTTVAATTEAETTTTEPETTTEAVVTTTKAAVTTTKAPVTTTKAPVTTTKQSSGGSSSNAPVDVEQGTLPAGLNDCSADSSYSYETKLASYNDDANTIAAYNDALNRGVKPTRIYYKNGKYSDVIYTGWDEPYDTVFLCKRCGKPEGHGTHGTCTSFFNDVNCPICGQFVKAGVCHTCKY